MMTFLFQIIMLATKCLNGLLGVRKPVSSALPGRASLLVRVSSTNAATCMDDSVSFWMVLI